MKPFDEGVNKGGRESRGILGKSRTLLGVLDAASYNFSRVNKKNIHHNSKVTSI